MTELLRNVRLLSETAGPDRLITRLLATSTFTGIGVSQILSQG